MEGKMMVPDARKKPDWANYWGQDVEGRFWWVQNKPIPSNISTPVRIERVKDEDMVCVTIYPLETGAKA